MGNIKTKVVINSTTIKDDSSGSDPRLLFNWEFERTTESGIAELTITAPRSINDAVTLAVGQTITVEQGFTTSTDGKIFDGFISEFRPRGGIVEIICRDKMWDLVRKNVNKIYQDTESFAGQISAIAEDLIQTFGGLTAVVQPTGTATGETIGEFRCVHTDIYERLMALARAVNYQVWYDSDADLVHFEPRGFNASGVTLTTGVEIIGVPDWDYDTSRMVNDLRVDGAVAETQLRLPTDTGSNGTIGTTTNFETTGITLPKTPETVQLIIDASNPPTTVVEGGTKDASSSDVIYYIDKENKRVTPLPGTAFTATNRAIVNYTHFAPAPIHMENSDSKTTYGDFENEIVLTDIITVADAEARATEFLNRFSNPFTIGDLLLKRVSTLNVKVGDTVTVVDTINKPNVNETLVITKEILKYPGSNQEITVGDEALVMAGWQMNVEERLKRLEEKDIKTDDLLMELFNMQNTITNTPRYRKVLTANIAGDSLIYGNPSFGEWEAFKWGASSNFGFVLGHTEAGILGTSQLGSNTSTAVNHFVQQHLDLYTENFIDDDFEGAGDATWASSGSVTFTSGQIALSDAIDYNNGTITTAKLTSTEVSGSFDYVMSADGGTNFESVTSGTAHTFTNTGTSLIWRATENAATTGEISKIIISDYH